MVLSATILSCTKDDVERKDCNCNRVVDVITLKVVGTTQGSTTYYKYTTINDCTGLQRTSGWGIESVREGDCK